MNLQRQRISIMFSQRRDMMYEFPFCDPSPMDATMYVPTRHIAYISGFERCSE